MNILITGATGFIGSHLSELLSQDNSVTVYGTLRSLNRQSTHCAMGLNKRDNIHLVYCDVRSFEQVQEIIVGRDIDRIYHLAAQPIVQIASKSPLSTYLTNMMGTVNVLEAVRVVRSTEGKEIPVLVMSSDKAYGPSTELPYTEEHPLGEGTDIYSSSKSCADIISRAYAYNYNLPIVIARPVNTYGELDFNLSRLIPTLVNTHFSVSLDKLVLNKGSYHYKREFLYVKDTVSGLKALMDNIDKTRGKAYNVASGEVYSTKDVVNAFINLTGFSKPIEFGEKKSTFKEIEHQYADSSKISETTGWSHEYNLEMGLTRTIEGYRNWFQGVPCTQ